MSDELKKAEYYIYVISDATGETAETVTLAALSQFKKKDVIISRTGHVRSDDHIRSLVKEAAEVRGLIVHTLVSDRLRRVLIEEAHRYQLLTIDIIGPLLETLSLYLGKSPQSKPGLLHKVDELYFKRIEAIDFTVKHDDGQNSRTIVDADIVLLGVSRTTKTPLSIYLAKEGWRVANVPIVLDIPPPQELFFMDQRKIVGLVIDPEKLSSIRKARLRHLGQEMSSYGDLEYIAQELDYCKNLLRKNRWPFVSVTNRAVEEVAVDIIALTVGKDRRVE
ncbi:MAG: kinase/pyrophosphorylase [Nitrospirae bacterium]|nr:kinase/pyrophosphorylase [Nitrospirota bacterium]